MAICVLTMFCLLPAGSLHAQQKFFSREVTLETFSPSQSPNSFSDSTLPNTSGKMAAWQNDAWLGEDKVKHFGASFLIALAAKYLAAKINLDEDASTAAAIGTAAMLGFAKEVADDLNPANIFSPKDLLADGLGILLAIFVMLVR
ncbi:MAG: hypothetical protein IAF08_05400 [Rhizobacter sp.]|nr:hypothetical protein [Chlorobiales bacterium]